ncbi:MAG: hypothetical protein JXC85_02065 [Candidatus Aenigmarchaeota archaeon]|nr:hypothetical protein [Candidatus Aenigmarchaeota archaeon]
MELIYIDIEIFFKMAVILGGGAKDDQNTEEAWDIGNILIELEEALAGFEARFRVGDYDEEDSDEEDPDDEEEEYDRLSLSEKVRKYQREFSRYVDAIRKDLDEIGYGVRTAKETLKRPDYAGQQRPDVSLDPDSEKSPSERGHKWGCGCPGCTKFRENFMSKETVDFSIPDGRTALFRAKDDGVYSSEHKDDASEYPCGGKLRGMFRHGFLKYSLAGVEKRPGLMRYMAV